MRFKANSLKTFVLAAFFATFASPVGLQAQFGKPTPGELPKEALEIYGDFLDGYIGKTQSKVNLVETTSVFHVSASERDAPCLNHFSPGVLDEKSQITHALDASLVNGRSVVLIDPANTKIADPEDAIHRGVSVDDAVKAGFAAGQLRLSEVIFDKDHNFAIFSYSFHCGRLCGSGGTVLLEKKDHKWVRSEEGCGTWIS
jgi:hypothetical protein